MKLRRLTIILVTFSLFLTVNFLPSATSFAKNLEFPNVSNAYDLIDAVNGLRVSRGLPPYRSNSILMGTAQSQANYLASTDGASGHIGPGGTHPIDRAIAAGYPVSGGFISENWVSGSNLDAQGAINYWMGDAPHQLTMLSSDLQDIGAGVAQAGNFYYYVIDCGLASGSAPVPTVSNGGPVVVESGTPSTQVATQEITISPVIVSTPDGKGNIFHIVQPGQSLWQIALAYKTTINKLQNSNNLPSTNIQAGQKLFILYVGTSTPFPATPTNTSNPASNTPLPTFIFFTEIPTETSTPTPALPLPGTMDAGMSVMAIIFVALTVAGLVAWVGRNRSI